MRTLLLSLWAALVLFVTQGTAMSLDSYWETPLGPYDNHNVGGKILFDASDGSAYWIGQNASDTIRVLKITRSTFTVAASAVYTGKTVTFNHSADQDDDALYIGVENDIRSYIKVDKATLNHVDTGDEVPNWSFDGPQSLHMGVTGTWSEGLLWGVILIDELPHTYHHLVGWDPTYGNIVYNTRIPDPTIGGESQINISRFNFDSNGDCWITSIIQGPLFADQDVVLTKATGPSTFGSPIELNGVRNAGVYEDGIIYDPATNALILTNRSPQTFTQPQWSNLTRYNIAGATVTYTVNYNGMHMTDMSGLGASGNGLRNIATAPVIFVGWHDPNDWEGPSTITMYNHQTGELITALPMQTGYGWPHNLALDPEGNLWMTSGADDSGPSAGQEHIHKLNITDALETARGYVSWAEMELPDGASGGGLEPYVLTYGTRWGLAMGLS